MSDGYQTIADVDAVEDEAEALAADLVEWLTARGVIAAERTPGPRYADAVAGGSPALLHTRPNRLEIVIERTVFSSLGADRIACPGCGAAAAWEPVSDAIDAWYAGGDGRLACAACGRVLGLNDWSWDPQWAFGYLGLTFWNWPPLGPAFVGEVAGRLGHRVVVVSGRL